MTRDELRALKPGDIIRNASGLGYVVTDNTGSRATAVRTVDVTNPDEWTLVGIAAPQPAQEPGTLAVHRGCRHPNCTACEPLARLQHR